MGRLGAGLKMATVEEIVALLQGRLPDKLVATVQSELELAEESSKRFKRQRIFEYLDDQPDGEELAEEYIRLKQEEREEAASDEEWRSTTWLRIQDLLDQLLVHFNEPTRNEPNQELLPISCLEAELDRLVDQWNTSMGSKCDDCGKIQKIHLSETSYNCHFEAHVHNTKQLRSRCKKQRTWLN